MFISFDENLIIRSISDIHIVSKGYITRECPDTYNWSTLIGSRLPYDFVLPGDYKNKPISELRVAIVCNWNDKCGISTYSNFLVSALAPKVKSLKVFSEIGTDAATNKIPSVEVEPCWDRGGNLLELSRKMLDWSPDFIIVQHEYGIFPNAFRFMQVMQSIKHVPNIVCMHSVYRHLDKLIYAEAIPNIIVHTQQGKDTLRELGNSSNIYIVPHGCVQSDETTELWNIMQSPYTVMQFGFGFSYKGVDRAIRAIAHLVKSDKKFKNLYYYYLCSTNSHNLIANQEYADSLIRLTQELDITDNVAFVVKYQSEKMLNLYLRLAKCVVFPYLINGDNMVYGSSGAVRVAMAAKRPVIVSKSHLFDDLEGVAPRPKDHIELAREIDEIFSNETYRNSIIEASMRYIKKNSWDNVSLQYLEIYNNIVKVEGFSCP